MTTRKHLKELLTKITPAQNKFFCRLYTSVDSMPARYLNNAVQQVNRTIELNIEKRKEMFELMERNPSFKEMKTLYYSDEHNLDIDQLDNLKLHIKAKKEAEQIESVIEMQEYAEEKVTKFVEKFMAGAVVIEQSTPSDSLFAERDYSGFLTISIDNVKHLGFHDGEPEDNSLARGFNDCYKIMEVLEIVYNLGKSGKEVIFVRTEAEED